MINLTENEMSEVSGGAEDNWVQDAVFLLGRFLGDLHQTTVENPDFGPKW